MRNALLLLLCLICGCQGLRLPDVNRLGEKAWPVSGGTSARTNARDVALPPTLAPTWTYNAEAGFSAASPLITGDVVLVGNRKGDIHAIRLDTGKRLGYVSVGASVEGASALDEHSIIAATAAGKKPLLRYNLRTGATAWRVKMQPVLAGVLVNGGQVVVADAEGRVAAHEVSTGALRWEHIPAEMAAVRAAPVQLPSGILIADDRGGLRVLNSETGAVVWAGQAAGPVYGTPATSGGMVYITTTRGVVQALGEATGQETWRVTLEDPEIRLAAPAVLGESLVVAGTDGIVRMLDARTGDELWQARTDGAVVAPPLVTRDVVFVGTMARELLALDRQTGEQQWTYKLRGRMKSAMAVAGISLIVLSEPRYVYRFDPEPAAAQ